MRTCAWSGVLVAVVAFGTPNASQADVGYDEGHATVSDTSNRDDWVLSLEAALQTPVDLGGRIGVELRPGLRVFGGYAWVSSIYIDVLTGLATSRDARLRALLDEASYQGRTWRLGLGVRPFHELGLYLDASYVRANLDASLELAETSAPELAELAGGYALRTELDLWLVELGYQFEVRHRLLLALGLGVLGTLEATSRLRPTGGAPGG